MCNSYLCIPFIYLYRLLVYYCSSCFAHKKMKKEPFEDQIRHLHRGGGGWFEHLLSSRMVVRDLFYILLSYRLKNNRHKHRDLKGVVQHLSENISANGQVPWCYDYHWISKAKYLYTFDGKRVGDANAQYLIMLWWLVEDNPPLADEMYVYALRAWHWINDQILEGRFYEETSWEHSLEHESISLLSNVFVIQAIRCMELISMTARQKRQQELCVRKHDQFKSIWVSEIYKTQETLPRILAVYWNIVPISFIASFNQSLGINMVCLRTSGPVISVPTTRSIIHGCSDQFTTVVWPFVGFLWIAVCVNKQKYDIAREWWVAYLEFHHQPTLYDMYECDSLKPVRRAFLRASQGHGVTLAMYCASHDLITPTLV